VSGGKKQTTNSNQNTATTTTLPEWMTAAGQQNYKSAAAYVNGPEATWDASKAAAYANPFQQQVQQNTLNTMTDQNAVDHMQLNDSVAGAKAYGGTRQAVLEAQQAKDQATAKTNYVASSNAQGYDAARAAFEADRNAKLNGFQTLMAVLQGTPRNVSTTGTSSGTQTQQTSGSFLDTMMGLGSLGIGAAKAGVFSDPRLKKHVSLIERLANGLGIYRFRYLWERSNEDEHIGVMADEVARIMPGALGPVRHGFLTVDYGKLAEALR
jgi:hypothetical protein